MEVQFHYTCFCAFFGVIRVVSGTHLRFLKPKATPLLLWQVLHCGIVNGNAERELFPCTNPLRRNTRFIRPRIPFFKSWAWRSRVSNPYYPFWCRIFNLVQHITTRERFWRPNVKRYETDVNVVDVQWFWMKLRKAVPSPRGFCGLNLPKQSFKPPYETLEISGVFFNPYSVLSCSLWCGAAATWNNIA